MGAGEVADLAQRKAALLVESDLNRQVFRLETEQIGLRLHHWTRTANVARGTWKWLAPVGALLMARKAPKRSLWLGLPVGLKLLRSALRYFKS